MNRTPLCLSLSFAVLHAAASAGPLHDRIQQRIDARQQALTLSVDSSESPSSELPLPPNVSLQRDIPYGNDPAQRMDVYIPQGASPAATPTAPVVFMVHGGGWRYGDKAMPNVVDNKVARWLPKGVVFVSINYRMLPQADPLTQADDVALALAKAQSLAASWGADRSRFVLMGHSAGAHLVALLAADPAIAGRRGAAPWLGSVTLDSAAFNVPQIMRNPHFSLYDDAFGTDPAYWRAASPLYRLNGKPGPLLAVCSLQREESCPQAREFVAKASLFGGAADVLGVNLTHGEINENLGKPGAYTERVERFMRGLGLPL
jgi:arylformamidase